MVDDAPWLWEAAESPEKMGNGDVGILVFWRLRFSEALSFVCYYSSIFFKKKVKKEKNLLGKSVKNHITL